MRTRERPPRARPSSLALTIACNASLQLQESVPDVAPSEEELEGTAAHWVARRYIAGYGHELPVNAKFYSEGREWVVDADMYAGAKLYERALGGYHPDMHIEEFVEIPRVHRDECAGTPDAWRFFPDAREAFEAYKQPDGSWAVPEGLPESAFAAGLVKLLRVGDYKYGHRYVEVFENAQLSAYAAGVLDALEMSDADDLLYVELILVQPRSYHRDGPVRVWRTKASNLRTVINDANDAVDRALMPLGESFAPKAETGPHCIDCRARHVCKALQANAMRLVDFSHTAERVELPPWALGIELAIVQDARKRLEAREEGLAAQAEALIRAGQNVPLYHMEPGRSVLAYHDDVNVEELIGLGDLIGVDLRKKLQRKDLVVTPTQAIQLGVDPAVMKAYASRSPGAMKLARDNSITARKVFSK
jgi:hypothetical protein